MNCLSWSRKGLVVAPFEGWTADPLTRYQKGPVDLTKDDYHRHGQDLPERLCDPRDHEPLAKKAGEAQSEADGDAKTKTTEAAEVSVEVAAGEAAEAGA
jgi:hypothetical protein